MDKERPKNPTTELRVRIFEEPNGKLDVQYECLIKGTMVVVPVRPTHVIGQLHAAAQLIAWKSYVEVNLKGGKSGTG